MSIILWATALVAVVIVYLWRVYSRFSDKGVKNRIPAPLFGNMWENVLRIKNNVYVTIEAYHDFASERFFGHYEFMNPLLVVKDLDLIKKITVKDFEYFADHRSFVNKESDPLFGNNLFSMAGQDWKEMRSTLSPAFTSSKIKLMVPFMVEVGNQMLACLKKRITESGVGCIEEEVKMLSTRYANDVIASCAFGLKIDSYTDENNEFYLNGKEASSFDFVGILKSLLFRSLPDVIRRQANLSIFSENTKNFFMQIVAQMMKERDEKNIVRPDMIQLLMDAKKGRLTHDDTKNEDAGFATVEESDIGLNKHSREWTDVELTAQAVIFFFAGFDTVSTALTFLLLELSLNPEIQDKLVEEIRETDRKYNGKFDYKAIQDMMYLDMVVSELMRMWPPAQALDRLCVKDYNMGKPNPKAKMDYIVRKGEAIAIPSYAIHHDPQYFPNPDKFDPERFSEQNRRNIKPFTYMPFGLGPRNCIGSRFALCEVKVMVYQLLKDIEVSRSPRTQVPIEFDPASAFIAKAKGGHWVRMSLRK